MLGEGVKRCEPSNGLDTALYKCIPLPFLLLLLKTNMKSWFNNIPACPKQSCQVSYRILLTNNEKQFLD